MFRRSGTLSNRSQFVVVSEQPSLVVSECPSLSDSHFNVESPFSHTVNSTIDRFASSRELISRSASLSRLSSTMTALEEVDSYAIRQFQEVSTLLFNRSTVNLIRLATSPTSPPLLISSTSSSICVISSSSPRSNSSIPLTSF